METNAAGHAQNEIEWTPWLRSLVGVRADVFRFRVTALDPGNSGTATAGVASPKGGLTLGPWMGTEIYANAGVGYHSNDARGTTITRDTMGNPLDPVTPLVRARGAETGVRTVAIPHLQSTVSVWTLRLDSELLFVGDAGVTEASRPSERHGVEWANYYTPRPWLMFDGDVSWSRARFTNVDPAGDLIPGSVQRVVSLGATVDSLRDVFGSVRWRYFGPRPLVEDGSRESSATSLVNVEVGYRMSKLARITLDVFNVMNTRDSDIDYYYTSRLQGEPADGATDIHFHPALPRTARVTLSLGF